MLVTESILINCRLEKTYLAFKDLSLWEKILPDVKKVNILYDDNFHQEFLMSIDRPSGLETIRGIRYCYPYEMLEVFHPVPPPGIKYMQGTWKFIANNKNSIKVVATRNFSHFNAHDENNFAQKLKQYLFANLNLFKIALEGK